MFSEVAWLVCPILRDMIHVSTDFKCKTKKFKCDNMFCFNIRHMHQSDHLMLNSELINILLSENQGL